jgi:hypothetical protein
MISFLGMLTNKWGRHGLMCEQRRFEEGVREYHETDEKTTTAILSLNKARSRLLSVELTASHPNRCCLVRRM